MLKKIAVVLLTVITVGFTAGVPLTEHYCASSKASWRSGDMCCLHKQHGKDCKKQCCQTRVFEVLKVTDSYLGSASVTIDPPQIFATILTGQFLISVPQNIQLPIAVVERPPPKLLSRRLSLLQTYLC